MFDDHGDHHDGKDDEELLKVFHKHLNGISRAANGIYPAHWHVKAVIEAKFGKDASHLGMHEPWGPPLGDAW